MVVETAKFESADSALEAIKAKLVERGAEGNRLGKRVETPIPGDPKEDEAAVALPEQLVADALHVVEKSLRAAKG